MGCLALHLHQVLKYCSRGCIIFNLQDVTKYSVLFYAAAAMSIKITDIRKEMLDKQDTVLIQALHGTIKKKRVNGTIPLCTALRYITAIHRVIAVKNTSLD